MTTPQFVSALELATYFNGTTELADLTPEWIAQADLLLQMVSADVQAAAGVPIEAGSGAVLLPGVWSRDLQLPYGPVRSVSSVSVNGVALGATAFTYNDRSLLRRGTGVGILGDFDGLDDAPEGVSAQGAQSRAGRSWGGPAATIGVVYGWGFTEIPGFVQALVFRIAARTFGNVAQLTQESLAIYSVSYGQSTNTNDGSHVTAMERKRLRSYFNPAGGTITTGGR